MAQPGLDERVARLEGRVEGFEDRFASLERRLDALDRKLDTGLAGLDQKLTRYFIWTVGIQVAVLLAVVTALA